MSGPFLKHIVLAVAAALVAPLVLGGCERPATESGPAASVESGGKMGTIAPSDAPDAGERQAERDRMVDEQLAARGIKDRNVLGAMRRVERHQFVPAPVRPRAYQDSPLPVGKGQTALQPYLVGMITELGRVEPDHRILVMGSGSGYQAAVLAEIKAQVVAVEHHCELANWSRDSLARQGYDQVEVHCAKGQEGWPAGAPFDRIIVSAAAPELPQALVKQLKPGGRMILGLGSGETQELTVVDNGADGTLTMNGVELVRLAPMPQSE
ncbi:protein-L-isoaspartate O-methyltransferase [Lujinxingia litoralis]|uniref:Protein-L-isoaspartate O-methyltransferase n=1 Tax=Lujinxingia litoralis TaxID=2211119 RepID=A0A328C9U6_9DELT|nr:protein-L-isoaspartate(D-aspartate) O-methyltransferase [Lujinxingia litoralis]RAL25245.1 protein-L-isoaspartate O-methyltransferase [Lujinxingia litoralis]